MADEMRISGVEAPAGPAAWRLRWWRSRLAPTQVDPRGVDASDQTALVELVHRVAADLRLAPPDSIWLIGNGEVSGWARRNWRQVRLPLPWLQCVAADDVR